MDQETQEPTPEQKPESPSSEEELTDLTVIAVRVSGPIGGPVRIQVDVHVEDKDGAQKGVKSVSIDVTNPGNIVEGITRVAAYLDRTAQKVMYTIVDRAQKDPKFAKVMGLEI